MASAGSETADSHIASDTTGVQSQPGATWRHALTATINSGFAWGTPRSENYKGVREGREEGMLRGVGRTGKGPAPVPLSMLRALGVVNEHSRTDKAILEEPETVEESHTVWRTGKGPPVPQAMRRALDVIDKYPKTYAAIVAEARVIEEDRIAAGESFYGSPSVSQSMLKVLEFIEKFGTTDEAIFEHLQGLREDVKGHETARGESGNSKEDTQTDTKIVNEAMEEALKAEGVYTGKWIYGLVLYIPLLAIWVIGIIPSLYYEVKCLQYALAVVGIYLVLYGVWFKRLVDMAGRATEDRLKASKFEQDLGRLPEGGYEHL